MHSDVDTDRSEAIAKPPDDELTFDPVSVRVNKATIDDPQCVAIQRELF